MTTENTETECRGGNIRGKNMVDNQRIEIIHQQHYHEYQVAFFFFNNLSKITMKLYACKTYKPILSIINFNKYRVKEQQRE